MTRAEHLTPVTKPVYTGSGEEYAMTDRLADMARRHWQEHLPEAYASIENPDEWFANLAADAQARIEDLTDDLAGADPEGEEYSDALARHTTARHMAEEQIIREMILVTPEADQQPETPDADDQVIEDSIREFQAARAELDARRFDKQPK